MKKITNWRNATVSDVESNGFLLEATLLHVVSMKLASGKKLSIRGDDKERLVSFLNWHLDNGIPVVGHNYICYDIPLLEKLLEIDLSNLMVIDTLALSWYLNIDRSKHGLDSFFSDYGIQKPPVDDWEGLTYEEYEYRCEQDVEINSALWEDFKERLIDMYSKSKNLIDRGVVGGKRINLEEEIYLDRYRNTTSIDQWVDNILTFLMYKMDNVRIKEKTMWLTDVKAVEKLNTDLSTKIEESKATLETVMPPVPKYTNKKFPKKPVRKGNKGEPDIVLSSAGEK